MPNYKSTKTSKTHLNFYLDLFKATIRFEMVNRKNDEIIRRTGGIR